MDIIRRIRFSSGNICLLGVFQVGTVYIAHCTNRSAILELCGIGNGNGSTCIFRNLVSSKCNRKARLTLSIRYRQGILSTLFKCRFFSFANFSFNINITINNQLVAIHFIRYGESLQFCNVFRNIDSQSIRNIITNAIVCILFTCNFLFEVRLVVLYFNLCSTKSISVKARCIFRVFPVYNISFGRFSHLAIVIDLKNIGNAGIQNVTIVCINFSFHKGIYTFGQTRNADFAICTRGKDTRIISCVKPLACIIYAICRLLLNPSPCSVFILLIELKLVALHGCNFCIRTALLTDFLQNSLTICSRVFREDMNIVQPISQTAIRISRDFCHRNRDKERLTCSLDRIRCFGFKHKVKTQRQFFKLNNATGICRFRTDFSYSCSHATLQFITAGSSIFFCIFFPACRPSYIFTIIIVFQFICTLNLINGKGCTCQRSRRFIFAPLNGFRRKTVSCLAGSGPSIFTVPLILMNRNGTGILRPNRICSGCRCCSTAIICHCWHSAQAEGQGGAQQACEKTFCFFHFSTSSLKKIIIGWAAGPPGLRVLHQHGVQCGALQRGNAAAPPALCREEKRRKNRAACPLGLRCI